MTTGGWKNSSRGLIGPGKHAPVPAKPRLTGSIPSDLRGATEELQEKLGHSSSLHDGRNLPALKAAVMEVERLIDRLSEFSGPAAVETRERIEEDWKLGWDGIVKEPTRARKAQRPRLILKGVSDISYP